MKAVYIRLLCAVLLLAAATLATTVRAAKSAPVRTPDVTAGAWAAESSTTSGYDSP
ncbi:MAG TPA: hypothetical protein VLB69_14130 [Rudaea sp.]|nr:hypothetical protein [Rudaea sp.]